MRMSDWSSDVCYSDLVVFGASLPFTGPYEKVSKTVRDGYDFWRKTVGGKMTVAGKTREVKWIIYDDENNASRSAQLMEKLISDDKENRKSTRLNSSH